MSLPWTQLRKGAGNARSVDTTEITKVMADWLNDPHSAFHADPQLLRASRANRGVVHATTGYLLTSLDVDWDNPQYVASASTNGPFSRSLAFLCRHRFPLPPATIPESARPFRTTELQ